MDAAAPEAGTGSAAAPVPPQIPARPPQQKSRTILWVFLILLLLAGSNAATYFLASRTEPAFVPPTQQFGSSFGALAYWLVAGPFPAKSGTDLDAVHDPDNPRRDVTATMKTAGKTLKWKLVKMQGNQISLNQELGVSSNCVGYGLTYVECPVKTKAILGVGSDDSVAVWLNGEKVHENREQRGCVVDSDHANVMLVAGVNEIFIKVGQGTGEWGFALTIRGADGKTLPGLRGCLPKAITIPKPPAATPSTIRKPPSAPKPTTPTTPTAKPTTTPAKPTVPPAAPTTPAKPVTPPAAPAAPTTPAKPAAPPPAPTTSATPDAVPVKPATPPAQLVTPPTAP
jgi:hypothetical protein